jgi:hypothetical protein
MVGIYSKFELIYTLTIPIEEATFNFNIYLHMVCSVLPFLALSLKKTGRPWDINIL